MERLLSTIIGKIQNNWWVACKVLPPKEPLIMCLVLICTIAPVCLGRQTAQAAPYTVAIAFDTSPTSHGTEVRQAAVNFYRSCSIGERVLLFVVRGSDTQMVFACTKTADDREFADFVAIVNGIKIDWLAHAKLATALSGPVYQQVSQHCSQNGHAIVVVITTGNFSDSQARDICKFGSNIKHNHKWSLLTTGLVDETPRQIFLTATAGELYWYNLTDAVHSTMVDKWLKDIKYELTDKPSQATNQPAPSSTTVRQPEPNHPDISKLDGNEANTIIIVPNKMGNTTVQNPQSKAGVVAPLPVVADTYFQKDRPNTGITKDVQTEKSPAVAAPLTAEPNTSLNKSLHADPHTKAPSAAKTPARATKDINVSHCGPAGTPPKGNNFTGSPMPWKEFIAPLLAIAGGVIACIILLIAWRSWNRAKNWKRTAKQRIDAFTNKPHNILEILMAQVGAASYRLGNMQRFRRIYVGNSAKNAIRIEHKGIIDRHLKIYRWFSSLLVRNLSTKSVMVNGHRLAAGKKIKLLLPAEITACEGVVIRLFVSKPDVNKTAQLQEAADGTRK
jgi:hypothetical protein